MAESAKRSQPPPLTAKEERVVLGLMQQGKSNLAIINHFTTQDMELTLEQVLCGGLRYSKAAASECRGARATRTPRNGAKGGGGARLKPGPETPPPVALYCRRAGRGPVTPAEWLAWL